MAEPKKITWLHLSDLHIWGKALDDLDAVLDALWSDISEQMAKGLRPDFIAFTGDVARSGRAEEYKLAEEYFFGPLLEVTALSPGELFIVPGNHDVDWRASERFDPSLLPDLADRDDVASLTGDAQRLLSERMRNYAEFVHRFFGQPPGRQIPQHPPYHYLQRVAMEDRSIALVCLDSAWFSGLPRDAKGDVNDQGNLRIGERELDRVLKGAGQADLCIVLLHHPLAWLREEDRVRTERRLEQVCDFVLHGHHHASGIAVRGSAAGRTVYIPAGAVYGHRGLPRVYSFVQVDLETRQATYEFRRYYDERREWAETDWSKETPVLPPEREEAEETVEPAVDSLLENLRDSSWRVRRDAARELGKAAGRQAVRPLIQALADRSKYVRQAAAEALGRLIRVSDLAGLVIDGSVEPQEALAVVRVTEDAAARVEMLLALASQLNGADLQDALTVARQIGDSRLQRQAVERLKARLPTIGEGDRVAAANDLACGDDRLGFSNYAAAFEKLIEDTEPPLTIGVYGAWGTGKTFLMNMIAKDLGYERDRKPAFWENILGPLIAIIVPLVKRFIDERSTEEEERERKEPTLWQRITRPLRTKALVVGFEAWDYNGCDKLWAGLVERIFRSIEESRLGWYGQIRLNLVRNLQHRWRTLRARLLPYTLISIVVGLLVFALFLSNRAAWAALVGSSAGFVALVKELSGILFTPASKRIVALFATPDYKDDLGFMGRIRQDLEGFAESLPDGVKVVIFIDDLDRCDPRKAVEVLEAVKLLLEFERFIVFIALDARIITQAVEEHYGQVLAEAEITGYEYLDKIVQIPFSIPEPPLHELRKFVASLVNPKEKREEKKTEFSTPLQLERSDSGTGETVAQIEGQAEEQIGGYLEEPTKEEAEEKSKEPSEEKPKEKVEKPTEGDFEEAERKAFDDFCSHLDPNPRRVKRLVNVYRLVRALINQREALEGEGSDAAAELPKNPRHILGWLVLCEQWPYAAHIMLETLDRETGLVASDTVDKLYDTAQPNIDDEALQKLDLKYDRLQDFLNMHLAELKLGDVQRLRPFTVNFNPALSAEVRLTLRSGEHSPAKLGEEK